MHTTFPSKILCLYIPGSHPSQLKDPEDNDVAHGKHGCRWPLIGLYFKGGQARQSSALSCAETVPQSSRNWPLGQRLHFVAASVVENWPD